MQDAWLRWAGVDEAEVQHAGAFLSRLVTNLCLDALRSAAAQREHDVGVWLPEPMLEDEALFGWAPEPGEQSEFAQDVSIAFMLALERLSPLERAAFLLHDVFDLDYDEIARHLGRNEPLLGGALIARTFIGFTQLPTSRGWRRVPATVNGLPGCLVVDDAAGGRLVQTIALAPAPTASGCAAAVYLRRNPDKLEAIARRLQLQSQSQSQG